ncbi:MULTISPECIES: MarR family winged helix-turn-helix transcriptional regulator [unclassified Adlercreutzia]|uniref:MarR family winged helix-turn-helix transcriptional regulator n=1 Tax=unclassified Adlercreutzia TaxID=2636013 RepID=UPI0013ED675A|nr:MULTISPECIES: MarR family transcriptional regulator [unclassified Adlercreutzia]
MGAAVLEAEARRAGEESVGLMPHAARRASLANAASPQHRETVEDTADYLTLMHLLSRSIDQVLVESCALTTLQYRILLRLLGAGERRLRVSDLSDNLSVGLSTVSAAVAKLADERLVRRVEAPSDMRVFELELTAGGLHAIERADARVGEFLEAYWRCLTREQLEAAIVSSLSAVCIHGVQRIENGHHRLDTAFFDTVMISRTLTARKLATCGLRTAEFRILVDLYLADAPATCSQVARRLFLNSSDVTSPIKHLEASGFLTKLRSADNRRAKHLALTPAGRQKATDLLPLVFDALLETCHSNEEAVGVHLRAARQVVEAERATMFA